MDQTNPAAVEALIVALPESSGSALYGMLDVLAVTGSLWQELVGEEERINLIRPRIVSLSRELFRCGNGIPITPDVTIEENPTAELIILPEMWLAPDDDMQGRYPKLIDWIVRQYQSGSTIYSACSGSVLLAATGLLNGLKATSHWGYENLFRTRFPEVQFNADPNLVFADQTGRIVTAGGTTSWHDLAIHIISRHCSPGEALRIAKVYLLKWHAEGQLPYKSLVRRQSHADSVVRHAEEWLAAHFTEPDVVSAAVDNSGIPERTFKRRFKVATGATLIGYVQNLRIEEAKRHLETGQISSEEISVAVGYDNTAFFRRLFKRSTGLTPGHYRRMFRPFATAAAFQQRK